MRWVAYWFLFVFSECGKETVEIPPKEPPSHTTEACVKIANCGFIKQENIALCSQCMVAFYSKSMPFTIDFMNMFFSQMSCQEIEKTEIKQLLFQCSNIRILP